MDQSYPRISGDVNLKLQSGKLRLSPWILVEHETTVREGAVVSQPWLMGVMRRELVGFHGQL